LEERPGEFLLRTIQLVFREFRPQTCLVAEISAVFALSLLLSKISHLLFKASRAFRACAFSVCEIGSFRLVFLKFT